MWAGCSVCSPTIRSRLARNIDKVIGILNDELQPIAARCELANVATFVPVFDGTIPDPEQYKYVHDYR